MDPRTTHSARFPARLPQGAGLAILRAVGRGRRTVSEIIELTGLSQPNVSNHLARFRQRHWVQTERSGRNIEYSISDSALAAYLEQIARAGRTLSEAEKESLLERGRSAYLQAAELTQPEVAEHAIDELLDAGVAWQEIYLRVFVPTLRHVGELWEQGQLSIAAEHASTALTQRIMSRLVPRRLPGDRAPLGMAVVGCVAGERHSVGARMVAEFFQASGWCVRLLGEDVPTAAWIEFVRVLQPDIVALSATVDDAEEALGDAVTELCRLRGDAGRPLLIGGGQWFDRHPEHGLPLDLLSGDLRSIVAEAGRCVQLEEG